MLRMGSLASQMFGSIADGLKGRADGFPSGVESACKLTPVAPASLRIAMSFSPRRKRARSRRFILCIGTPRSARDAYSYEPSAALSTAEAALATCWAARHHPRRRPPVFSTQQRAN